MDAPSSPPTPPIPAADSRGCHKHVRFDGDDASSSSSKRTAPSDALSCCILAKSIALPSRPHCWVRVLANCCVGWCHLHCRSSPPLLLHHKTFFVKPHRHHALNPSSRIDRFVMAYCHVGVISIVDHYLVRRSVPSPSLSKRSDPCSIS